MIQSTTAVMCVSIFPGVLAGPVSLYPFGDSEGDSRVPNLDDGSSPAVTLDPPPTFFGTAEGTLYVRKNS